MAGKDEPGDCRRCGGTGVCPRCGGEGVLSHSGHRESTAAEESDEECSDDSVSPGYYEGNSEKSSGNSGESSGTGTFGCLWLSVAAILIALVIVAVNGNSNSPRSPTVTVPLPTREYYQPPQSSESRPPPPPLPMPTVSIPAVLDELGIYAPWADPRANNRTPQHPPDYPPPVANHAHGTILEGDMLYVVNVSRDDPEQLNVRSGPGQDFESIGWISWNGYQVEYLGTKEYNQNDLWVYVRWGHTRGWVLSKYLRAEQ